MSMDLDQVMSFLKKLLAEGSDDYTSYCRIIERLERLIIDEPDTIGKDEILRMLRGLAYFRPKDILNQEKTLKKDGIYSSKPYQMISMRHKELMRKNQ
jgi:hypothetical protein